MKYKTDIHVLRKIKLQAIYEKREMHNIYQIISYLILFKTILQFLCESKDVGLQWGDSEAVAGGNKNAL